MHLEMDENLFIPVSLLNALRRDVLSRLESKITSYDPSKTEEGTIPTIKNPKAEKRLEAVVSTVEQWKAVCNEPVFTWFRMECLSKDLILECTQEALEREIPWGISLPYIQQSTADAKILRELHQISDSCPVLVHNPGQLEMLKSTSHPCTLDFTIPVTNSQSLAYWQQEAEGVTLSTELTFKELECLPPSSASLIVYGQIPVMLSEQCVRKEQGLCNHSYGYSRIRDRKEETWICEHHCGFCYTALYPQHPVWIADRSRILKKLPVSRYRMMFLQESLDETLLQLQQYKKALFESIDASSSIEYHRGHFYKGIE